MMETLYNDLSHEYIVLLFLPLLWYASYIESIESCEMRLLSTDDHVNFHISLSTHVECMANNTRDH